MGMSYAAYFISYLLSNTPILLLYIAWLAFLSKGIIYHDPQKFILINFIGGISIITQAMLLGTFIPYETLAGMLSKIMT